MNCDEVNERLPAFLFSEGDEADRKAVEAHLRTCPACGEEVASLRGTRALLERWETPESPMDVDTVLTAARFASSQIAPPPRRRLDLRAGVVGIAAGVAAFLVLSQFQVGWLARGTGVGAEASSQQYLLLLYQSPGGPLSGEESGLRVEEYSAWASAGRRDGTIVMGAKLASSRHWLPDGTDAPPQSGPSGSDDVVVGYFRLIAGSMDEATQIARTCPHLKYGGRVELRPIDDEPRG